MAVDIQLLGLLDAPQQGWGIEDDDDDVDDDEDDDDYEDDGDDNVGDVQINYDWAF